MADGGSGEAGLGLGLLAEVCRAVLLLLRGDKALAAWGGGSALACTALWLFCWARGLSGPSIPQTATSVLALGDLHSHWRLPPIPDPEKEFGLGSRGARPQLQPSTATLQGCWQVPFPSLASVSLFNIDPLYV